MHANPQRLQNEAPGPTLRLLETPDDSTLSPLIFRFLNLLRRAVWRAFQHDAFAIAKASAYSSILTFFPTLLVLGSVLQARRNTQAFSREISDALTRILPAGTSTAQAYLRGSAGRSFGLLFTTSLLTLFLGQTIYQIQRKSRPFADPSPLPDNMQYEPDTCQARADTATPHHPSISLVSRIYALDPSGNTRRTT